MPTAVATETRAYAHCINPRCPGYGQEEVPAVSTETSYTFRDHGGDSREVFRSFVELRYAVDADESDHGAYGDAYRAAAACPHCARPRELAATQRPTYLPLSGHDPLGLLGMGKFNPAVVNTEADAAAAEAVATQNRAMAEQAAELATLKEQMAILIAALQPDNEGGEG